MSTLDAHDSPTQSGTDTNDEFELPTDQELYRLAYKHLNYVRTGETRHTFGPTYNGYAGSLEVDSGMTEGVWVNNGKGTKGTWKETATQGVSEYTGKDTQYTCFAKEENGRGVAWGVNERGVPSGEKRVITEQEMPESVQLAWQEAGNPDAITKASPSSSTYAASRYPQAIRPSVYSSPGKTAGGLPKVKCTYGPEEPRQPLYGFTTKGVLKGPTTKFDREVGVGRDGSMRHIICADERVGIYDPKGVQGGEWTRQNMSHEWFPYKVAPPNGGPELSIMGFRDRIVDGPGWEWDCVEGADGPLNVKSFTVDPTSGGLVYRSHQEDWDGFTS
jgi:hypothetical protein